jgi:16S rRNA (cytosine1402-N4)-methyltransferase
VPEPTCHVPVLPAEIAQWLQPAPGKTIVDGTLGGGGHSLALAQQVVPGGRVYSVDLDQQALDRVRPLIGDLPVTLSQGNFAELPELLQTSGIGPVDGILLDLGLSSDQLADTERGFSFQTDGELDLRFDTSQGEAAWEVIDRLDEHSLADLIYQLGEERFSRRIAKRIVETRQTAPIRTADELAQLVRSCVPRSRGHRIDPATRTFQALRIAVNGELSSLERALSVLPDCLIPGGRLAIISFHSLEDRRVKEAFRDDERYEALTRRPIRPSEAEVATNPRARSAKFRVARRNDEK